MDRFDQLLSNFIHCCQLWLILVNFLTIFQFPKTTLLWLYSWRHARRPIHFGHLGPLWMFLVLLFPLLDHFETPFNPFLFSKTTLPWPCSWRRARRPGPHPLPWKWARQPNKVSWCQQLTSTGILSFVMSNSSRYLSNKIPTFILNEIL